MSNPLMLQFRRVAFQFLQSKRQRISSSLILSCISDTLLPDFQRQASRSLHCNQCIYIHKSAFNSPFDVIPACRESDFYQSQMLPGLDPPVPPKVRRASKPEDDEILVYIQSLFDLTTDN